MQGDFIEMANLAERIFSCFKSEDSFSLSDAYSHFNESANETIRARIYENLGIKFQRIAKYSLFLIKIELIKQQNQKYHFTQ